MLKLTSLAFGLITLVTFAPSSKCSARAALPVATIQNQLTVTRIAGNLSAQKLSPIKRSSPLNTTVIDRTVVSTPPAKKPRSSPEVKENRQLSVECRRAIEARPQFSSNERPIPDLNNPFKDNVFNNSNRETCTFSVPIIE